MCRSVFAITVSAVLIAGFAAAQDKAAKTSMHKAEMSNAAYTAQALSAAPKGVAKDAGVMRMTADGSMKTLRDSKNGFNCMIMMGNKMCADENSMAFFEAMMKKQNPPDKLGVAYMLRGDDGASNTDPTAEKKTADNHWVVTGPHIMVVGPGVKSMGLSDAADADPNRPYLMWANTPYAHAMIPVAGSSAAVKNTMAMPDNK